MKVHIITYGNAHYAMQRENFRTSALNSKLFDEVKVFTPDDMDRAFVARFHHILSFRRGGGYWLWKPYIVKKALDHTKEGDVLIYCDAGCMINYKGRDRFYDYLELLLNTESGALTFELPFKEYEFTKQEIFEYFKASEELINSNQRLSGIILLKKCASSMLIINKWLQAVYDDAWLFTDYLRLYQRYGFKENRHDQSIFSMLTKIYGAASVPDETYFLNFEEDGEKFPFWATRLSHL